MRRNVYAGMCRSSGAESPQQGGCAAHGSSHCHVRRTVVRARDTFLDIPVWFEVSTDNASDSFSVRTGRLGRVEPGPRVPGRTRTRRVYAPVLGEEASDAVHGSLGFNPMLQAPGAMTDAAASGAFGTSRGQHATATATPRRMSAAPLSGTHGEPQADAAVDQAWEQEDEAAAFEELRLMQRLEELRMARSTRKNPADIGHFGRHGLCPLRRGPPCSSR